MRQRPTRLEVSQNLDQDFGQNPRKILFVCLGNICRSPAAQGVFRALGSSVSCDSAGTADYHVGAPPYGAVQQAMKRRGLDVSDLRARQFSPSDFSDFDLILAMDQNNLDSIEAQRPAGNQTPVQLFTRFAPEAAMDHVPDPYYTRDFDGCLDLIELAAAGLVRAVAQGEGEPGR
jgi:protein-tyrosine phosphatase